MLAGLWVYSRAQNLVPVLKKFVDQVNGRNDIVSGSGKCKAVWQLSKTLKKRVTVWPSNSAPKYVPTEIENFGSLK